MGEVNCARNSRLGREVAVKILRAKGRSPPASGRGNSIVGSTRPTGRRPLPPQLPRERVEIEAPEAEKRCVCGTLKTRIGEAVSDKLDYVPASIRVIGTARPKYACPRCHDGV